MDSSIWLSKDQIAQLHAALLRARDELRSAEDDARAALRLALVESALQRLKNGTYGECVSCEEPLPFAVLEQRPEQPFCDECERERRRGARTASGG
ncbi:MAG TPA: hypothetical protein VIL20_07205 [Sandaracinaceae bacterium]